MQLKIKGDMHACVLLNNEDVEVLLNTSLSAIRLAENCITKKWVTIVFSPPLHYIYIYIYIYIYNMYYIIQGEILLNMVKKPCDPTLMLYNSDKTKLTFTPLFWNQYFAWFLVFSTRGHMLFQAKIATSAEEIYQKRPCWDAPKFLFMGAKYKRKHFACNFPHFASNF